MAATEATQASDVAAASRLTVVRKTRVRGAVLWRLALIGVVLSLIGPAAGAETQGAAQEQTVPIDATFGGYGKFEKVDCLSVPGTCEFYLRGHAEVSGSRVGTVLSLLHGHFTPEGFVYTGFDYFTGMIVGCGVGSVTHSEKGIIRDLVLLPLPNVGFGGFQEWAVVPGSGTGGLAGVSSGSGIDTFVIRPDGTRLYGGGRAVGSTTCTPS